MMHKHNPCSLSVLLLLPFLCLNKICNYVTLVYMKTMFTLCAELLCIILYCKLFCFCKISIQLLNLKVCVLAIIFQSLKLFIKNDWMRISKVSIDTGILTWDFQSDNCIWIMAVFKISTLILLEKCQKVQEHFLVCPRTGVNIFFCRVTN